MAEEHKVGTLVHPRTGELFLDNERITVDLHKLLDRTKTIRDGTIQHPDYDIGKWYYRQILWSGVLPVDKPLSEFSDDEMDRLLRAADWIVDIGPEGGKNGGAIVATGTPETIATHDKSYTGQYLKSWLDTPGGGVASVSPTP